MAAGIECVKMLGGVVVECACVVSVSHLDLFSRLLLQITCAPPQPMSKLVFGFQVELKLFINPSAESKLPNRTKLFESLGFSDVPVWGLISEDVLTNQAELPEGYVDDGEEH